VEKESQIKRKKIILNKVKYLKTRILKSSTKSGRSLVTLNYNNLTKRKNKQHFYKNDIKKVIMSTWKDLNELKFEGEEVKKVVNLYLMVELP